MKRINNLFKSHKFSNLFIMKTKAHFIMAGFLAVVCLVTHSCKSYSEDLAFSKDLMSEYDGNHAVEFHNTLTTNINSILEADVVVEPYDSSTENVGTRAVVDKGHNDKVIPVIVDMEFAKKSKDLNVSSIRSYGDMLELQTKYDVDFYVMENEPVGLEAVIYVSEEETLEALMPLIEQSKAYLYRKGFTDIEIDEMLAENNASPATLVPLALLLSEDEINSQLDKDNLIEECISFTRGEITLSTVLSCAIAATGADIIYSLQTGGNNSHTNKWTKKAIKLLFKKVAPRFLGPVGVGIAVVSFVACIGSSSLS